MQHFPDYDSFRELAHDVDLVPVYRRLVSDSLTPVSAFHKVDRGKCGCLFESVVGGERVGRYSFLAAKPYMVLEAHGTQVTVSTPDGSETFESGDPLAELESRVRGVRAAQVPDLPPLTSGAVGYAGYDVVRYSENLPDPPADDRQLPDLSFAFYDAMVVFDHIHKTIVVVAMAHVTGDDLRPCYEDACRRVDELVEMLSGDQPALRPADIQTAGEVEIPYTSNFDRKHFEEAVENCVEYIRAGDIFQVVISQRLQLKIRSHPFEIYRTLRVVNPSPFMFYVRTPSTVLVGSSPEILVRVVDQQVTVRPLAGTRRRGTTDEEDQALADELLADPKERAEHVMLVDLGRNDVGRVAEYRSVDVSDIMVIERYSHVMHITSNVTGKLADGKTAFDALRSCLPAGTVSGAPKVRAMEIIDEIEPHRRGPYAGAVGYVDFGGNMDTCIALRTIVIKGDQAFVQAGAGIVADSLPENEYHETLNKAHGVLKAIEITESRHIEKVG
ncbi:MAG: anthranilate synthase component I [Planctomycetota bacterium]|nr:anthranilate synthase component I [Planctomycetota bacterium]